jgi:hypothetical protein
MREVENDLDDARYDVGRRDAKRRMDELVIEVDGTRLEIDNVRKVHDALIRVYETRIDELEALDARRVDLDGMILHHENLADDASMEKEKYLAMVNGLDDIVKYTRDRENALWIRINNLQDRIGRESHREALEW